MRSICWFVLLSIVSPVFADLPNLGTRKQGSDWPVFLGPNGDSSSSEKGIINPWPVTGPKIVWQKEVGEGYGMPTISKGRLFQFDRHGNKARLTCMNAETGEEICRFEYPTDYRDLYNYSGGARCSPVIEDDRVTIFGVEGMLHCLQIVRTGKKESFKVLWKLDTQKKYGVIQNFFGVGSTPVIEGELLIVQIGGSPPKSDEVSFLKLKGNGTGVVAFDKKTGKEKWRASNELASYSSPVMATVNGRRTCFVFARGGLLALDPKTGKLDFRFPWRAGSLESVNASNPVVLKNRVFISETYGPGSAYLEVQKKGDPKVVWADKKNVRKKSMQCHWMTPIYHDGYLYGCSGRHDSNAELRCIELASGKVMWSKPGLARTSLLKIDGHLISLGEYGDVRLLKINPKQFQMVSGFLPRDEKGKFLLRYPCWAAPIVSHGLMYLRGKDRLVCVELIPKKK